MGLTRDIRRAALQALYQFDARGDDRDTLAVIRASLADSPGDEAAHEQAFALAQAAWSNRRESDAAVLTNTPEWPTHRQPAIDRNILRLALHEMYHAGTPPKVAINEAVELAREFSTERSPMFVNGVLDKIFKERSRAVDDAFQKPAAINISTTDGDEIH